MKKLKKTIAILFSLLCMAVFFGCSMPQQPAEEPSTPPAEAASSRVRVYDIPDGVKRYAGAEITVEGQPLPAYSVMVNTSQTWTGSNYQRTESGVCLFELDGTAQVTVKPDVQIGFKSVVRPLSAKITPIADLAENTLTFTFRSAGEYVLEINGEAYNAIHFFVSEYDESGVAAYTGYENIVVFGAGLHTAANDSRIDGANNNLITVKSNTLVYLADGAVVRGRFYAQNASRVALVGRGVIDGSPFERDAEKGTVTVPLEFNDCKDVLLKDFSVFDPAGWCVNFYFTEDSRIDNIKIITSRSNGDGISLQSCKNVAVGGCFVRTWDDSLVVKNYPRWENRSVHGATENISFTDCTVWTDLAQSMELGYETVGTTFQNVTFDRITVLHAMHKAVMSIHNANNAQIKDVAFRNITVEDGKNAADGAGIIDFRVLYSQTWSDQHTSPTVLGDISRVTVENINVLSARKFTAVLGGCYDTREGFESEHYVDGVTVKNVALAGARPALSECRISVTDSRYLCNFTFIQEENVAVTGAPFLFTQTDESLAALKGCKVEMIEV